jgi:hypothetical protein
VISDYTIKDACIVYIGHCNGLITVVSFNKANREFIEIGQVKGKSGKFFGG